MIRVVVDSNVIISALISPGRVRRVFFNEGLVPYAPRRLIAEITRHAGKLSEYTGIPRHILVALLEDYLPRWLVVKDEEEIPTGIRVLARRLAENVDLEDWPFIALAMYLDVPLWTGDKRLIRLAVETSFKHYKAVDTEAVEMLLVGFEWRDIAARLKRKYA